MRLPVDCLPCFIKQILISLKHAGIEEQKQFEIVADLTDIYKDLDYSRSPAYSTTFLHRRIRQILQKDPFDEIKKRFNEIALGIVNKCQDLIKKNDDKLQTITRLAIAGNIIDFGIFTSVDINKTIEKALNEPLKIDRYVQFKDCIKEVKRILYLTDNAGEIVFDKLLIEYLIQKGKEVTVAVKGSEVLNDATLEDAEFVGLDKICKVVDNGSDCVGTILEMTSSEFKEVFYNAQMIISKGQGNFETLHDVEQNIFFLFQSKCDILSKLLSVEQGAMLLTHSEIDYKML
ncbi:MAG: ARMT1-like domain-containing protein [Thermodesulfovibrionales bacterium]|nr:ARMT1-like domain-containing protein [Thermodesulfovibrionales bacterium]